MNEYRITKYNPENRNTQGHYLDVQDWTEFSDVGKKVSLEEYEIVEESYISSAIDFIKENEPNGLQIRDLQDLKSRSTFKEGDVVLIKELAPVLRSLLRGEYWCRLESEQSFIHFGWDYYMYIGVNNASSESILRTTEKGLYVEEFISPYHPENT